MGYPRFSDPTYSMNSCISTGPLPRYSSRAALAWRQHHVAKPPAISAVQPSRSHDAQSRHSRPAFLLHASSTLLRGVEACCLAGCVLSFGCMITEARKRTAGRATPTLRDEAKSGSRISNGSRREALAVQQQDSGASLPGWPGDGVSLQVALLLGAVVSGKIAGLLPHR